jgi:hypothetical protein
VNENQRDVKDRPRESVRRSQTVSVMSGALAPQLGESGSAGNRVKAYPDNSLSKTDRSWRSAQESANPTIGSSTNSSQRLTRNTQERAIPDDQHRCHPQIML